MKELPRNWYCKCLDETHRHIFINWRRGDHSGKTGTGVMTSERCWYFLTQVENSHTEISFETFERLVLGINKQTKIEIW